MSIAGGRHGIASHAPTREGNSLMKSFFKKQPPGIYILLCVSLDFPLDSNLQNTNFKCQSMSFLFDHNPANCPNDPTIFGSEENNSKEIILIKMMMKD